MADAKIIIDDIECNVSDLTDAQKEIVSHIVEIDERMIRLMRQQREAIIAKNALVAELKELIKESSKNGTGSE
jgi:hypothetical protein